MVELDLGWKDIPRFVGLELEFIGRNANVDERFIRFIRLIFFFLFFLFFFPFLAGRLTNTPCCAGFDT